MTTQAEPKKRPAKDVSHARPPEGEQEGAGGHVEYVITRHEKVLVRLAKQ